MALDELGPAAPTDEQLRRIVASVVSADVAEVLDAVVHPVEYRSAVVDLGLAELDRETTGVTPLGG